MSIKTQENKSFSTCPQGHRRRGHSPIRNRCLEFIQTLEGYGYTHQIPLAEAKRLFFVEMGIGDPKSIKAYFGARACHSVKKMQRTARYSSGAFSVKSIELSQEVPERKGYFELLGLASYELKGNVWFMTLTRNVLVPQLGSHTDEGSRAGGSIDEISLSVSCEGLEAEETSGHGDSVVSGKNTNTHTLQREREKLSLEKVGTKSLTDEGGGG